MPIIPVLGRLRQEDLEFKANLGSVSKRKLRWKYYVLTYENGKMRPAETITGMRGRGDKGEWRRDDFNYDML
jgi:hypothetical protein